MTPSPIFWISENNKNTILILYKESSYKSNWPLLQLVYWEQQLSSLGLTGTGALVAENGDNRFGLDLKA